MDSERSDTDELQTKASRRDSQESIFSMGSSELVDDIKSVEIDWQVDKTLPECLGTILSKEHLCDVSFQFPDEKTSLKSHKLILAARSPVFEAMLFGPAGEKDAHPVIQITDAHSSDFASMLEFMYTDKTAMSEDNALDILYLSQKYCLQHLISECSSYLAETLNETNVIKRLLSAVQLDLPILKDRCIIYVDEHAAEVFKEDSFCELSKETLNLILERDSLNISEIEVYRACISWASARCKEQNLEVNGPNLRWCLTPTIDLVRFPCMTASEVSSEVGKDGALTKDEMFEAICKIATPLMHTTKFNTIKRMSCLQALSLPGHFSSPIGLPGHIRLSIEIKMESRSFLIGFDVQCKQLYRSVHVQGEMGLKCLTDPIVGEVDDKCTYFSAKINKKADTIYVRLGRPLLLNAGNRYLLEMKLLIFRTGGSKHRIILGHPRPYDNYYTTQQTSGMTSLTFHSQSKIGLSGTY